MTEISAVILYSVSFLFVFLDVVISSFFKKEVSKYFRLK